MKPIIGITSDIGKENNYRLNAAYVHSIIHAGGMPVLLPVGMESDVKQLSKVLDGVVLTGGGDVDPASFNEEPNPSLGVVSPSRDSIEIEIVHELLRLNKPILGICRGLQILNVAIGGNMYQDIHSQLDTPILQHSQKSPRSHPSHFVQLEKGSLLELIAGNDQVKVNSFHHQAVKDVPKPLIISGVTSDGIIEAIESTEHSYVIGVQWHPEELAVIEDTVSLRLFESFIKACIESRKAY